MVGDRIVGDGRPALLGGEQGQAPGELGVVSDPVDCATLGDGPQPGARLAHRLLLPAHRSFGEGFGRALLSEAEVAVASRQPGDDGRPVVGEGGRDRGGARCSSVHGHVVAAR